MKIVKKQYSADLFSRVDPLHYLGLLQFIGKAQPIIRQLKPISSNQFNNL